MSSPVDTAPPAPSEAPPGPASSEVEARYYAQLRDAGLLDELNQSLLMELTEIARAIGDSVRPGTPVSPRDPVRSQRIDVLRRYYAADGDRETSQRRVLMDRFLLHREGDSVNAHGIVARLAALTPELGTLVLERVGDARGPLVIRAGERLSAVTDEENEAGEDDAGREDAVSVRALVGAVNGLLANTEFEARFVNLIADGWREVFVAMRPESALALLHASLLEHESEEWLVDFCAF